MIIEEIKNIKSSKKELRQFGITIGVVTGLLALVAFLRQKDTLILFSIVSVTFLFFGIVFPVVLKPIQKIWMSLAVIIGWFMTRVILIVLFYLVVTPLGLVAKIFGKGSLGLKFNPDTLTYWIPKDYAKDKKSYENQF